MKDKLGRGRPTKYDETIQKKADIYYDMCLEGSEILPSIEGLSLYININRDTIYEWIKIHPIFSDTYKKIMELQKKIIQEKGITGIFNPAVSIFMLKANHGMIETSRTELTGKDGKDLPSPIYGGKSK